MCAKMYIFEEVLLCRGELFPLNLLYFICLLLVPLLPFLLLEKIGKIEFSFNFGNIVIAIGGDTDLTKDIS